MNIYIYGNDSFKKEIHETLEHANIKFKLDDDSIIKDINDLDELKVTIEENPNDIYLIDDEKIIKKSGLSKKIKFLTPKDGIEEEFLLDNGIADVSVESLKEIPKYILQKHEQQQKEVSPEIQESIADIVDDAYSEDEQSKDESKKDEEKDSLLDDELAQLLSSDVPEGDLAGATNEFDEINFDEEESKDESEKEFPFDEQMDFESIESLDEEKSELPDISLDDIDKLMESVESQDGELSDEEIDSMINFKEDVGLNNVTFDYDDENLVDEESNFEANTEVLENEDIIEEKFDFDELMEDVSQKGEEMSNDFSELDSLNEADILSALDNLDDIKPLKTATQSSSEVAQAVSNSNQSIDVSSSNVNDIAGLISQLLNNKTLEITIKIKD